MGGRGKKVAGRVRDVWCCLHSRLRGWVRRARWSGTESLGAASDPRPLQGQGCRPVAALRVGGRPSHAQQRAGDADDDGETAGRGRASTLTTSS